MRKIVLLVIALVFGSAAAAQQVTPPLEAYGLLPRIAHVELSPDGNAVALVVQDGEREVTMVRTLSGDLVNAVDTSAIRVRSVGFLSNETLGVWASISTDFRSRIAADVELGVAFAIDLKDPKPIQLLARYDDLYPFQSGLGRIIGLSPDGEYAYMPAYSGNPREGDPRYDLIRVKLSNGAAKLDTRGRQNTRDWFVDSEGNPLLKEEYSNLRRAYELYAFRGSKQEMIFEITDVDIPKSNVSGIAPDGKHAVFYKGTDLNDGAFYLMSLADGSFGEELFTDGLDIDRLLRDDQRRVIGVEYAGMTPTYWFFDETLTEDVRKAQNSFPGHSVTIDSWSDDMNRLLLYIEGPDWSGAWFVYDRARPEIAFVATRYDNIPSEAVVDMEVFTYEARDGLEIEAVLTGRAPEGSPPRPLLVMPHGGPAAQDVIGFDWMAQYFASRGYTVFQPNFRGSTGYGLEFADLGDGEWGGKMQDDITDGVAALVKAGIATDGNACIIGASYGGYAALMGGATTPDLFKCVVAIAPVSDLNELIKDYRRLYGRDEGYRSRLEQFGVDSAGDRELRAVSPRRLGDGFKAPVLLIHGKDDTVVPFDHSKMMERELKSSGKDVTLFELKGEDHWLSVNETRLVALQAAADFIAQHLPAPPLQ